jgi:prepilin-type N-terminal cleavage/methylation domain-containing protein
MKRGLPKRALQRGVSLVETMVAIGVLAIVAPLALAALLKSGEGGAAARAETRSPAIVESCLAELDVARKGISEHLPTLTPGTAFGTDTVLCLAFRGDGTLLGRVDGANYEAGAGKVGSEDAVFLAKLEGELDQARPGYPPMLTVNVTVEHPAVAPSNKRRKMPFHTKLP